MKCFYETFQWLLHCSYGNRGALGFVGRKAHAREADFGGHAGILSGESRLHAQAGPGCSELRGESRTAEAGGTMGTPRSDCWTPELVARPAPTIAASVRPTSPDQLRSKVMPARTCSSGRRLTQAWRNPRSKASFSFSFQIAPTRMEVSSSVLNAR